MNIEKTREYYRSLTAQDICDCEYCQNYVRGIKRDYPELAEYFDGMGVDIEKPFEVIPIDVFDGKALYAGVQYVIMGSRDDFTATRVNGVTVDVAESHPYVEIKDEFFVVETGEISLKWDQPENEDN
ncbi:MAG: hypothetical protein IJI05_01155 [Erysipelotrichaceae bacterium]|nr:hypothetical protein [Erysipelotrichaceae bacterium]